MVIGIEDFNSEYKDPNEMMVPSHGAGSTDGPGFDLNSIVDNAAKQYGVDPNLLHGVIQAESSGNPKATSPVGAQGLMQLMPATAKWLGVQDPYNPQQNVEGGAKYLSQLIKSHNGDVNKALAAYNWGPGNVAKGGPYPPETQNYIAKVNKYLQGIKKNLNLGPTSANANTGDSGISIADFNNSGIGSSVPELSASHTPFTGDGGVDNNSKGSILDSILYPFHKPQGKLWASKVLIPSFLENLNKSQDTSSSSLPLGIPKPENKVLGATSDALYGVLEAAYALTTGAIGFFGGQAGGVGAALTNPIHPVEGLAHGQDVAQKVNEFMSYKPKTSTGKMILRPFEVVFGTLADTVNKSVELAGGNAQDAKAANFIANTVVLGLPMLKEKIAAGEKLTPQETAQVKEAATKVAEQVQEQAPGVKPNFDIVDTVSKAIDEAQKKVEDVPTPKDHYEGVGYTPTEELLPNINPEPPPPGHYKIGDQVIPKETSVSKVEPAVPDATPQNIKSGDVPRITKSDGMGYKVSDVEAMQKSLPTVPEGYVRLFRAESPTENFSTTFKPDALPNFDNAPKGTLRYIPDLEYADYFRSVYGKDANIHYIDVPKDQARNFELSTGEYAVPGDLTPSVHNYKETPEFDSTSLAKDQGYIFKDKRQFTSIDSAQKVADRKGPEFEVVKIGDRYRVGKYEEAQIPQFNSLEELQQSREVGSEIPKSQALAEAGTGESGFQVVQVGDKYYRSWDKYDMPSHQPELPMETPPNEGDVSIGDFNNLNPYEPDSGITPEDVALMKDMQSGRLSPDEVLKKSREELVAAQNTPVESKTPQDYAALAKSFADYRDSFVTKLNEATELYHYGHVKPGENFNFEYRGTGENNSILGPGFYFLDDSKVSDNIYGNAGRGSNKITIKVNPKDFYDPINGTPGLNDRVKKIADDLGLDIKSPYSTTKEGRGWIGAIVRKVGANKARELFVKNGIKGAVEVLEKPSKEFPNGLREYAVFDESLLNKPETNKTPIKPADVALIDDNFATFPTEEEARQYAAAVGKKGEIIQDPMSGRWYPEPELDTMDSYNWENGVEFDDSVDIESLSDEGPSYELGSGTAKDLLDEFMDQSTGDSTTINALGNIKSGKELAWSLASDSSNPLTRIIAEKVAEAMGDTKLRVVGNDTPLNEIPRSLHEANGLYRNSEDTIYLKQNLMGSTSGERTALHESIHAVTANKIREGIRDIQNGVESKLADGVKEIRNLSELVKDKVREKFSPESADAMLTKEQEFVAYGLSNKEFQDVLKSVPVGRVNAFSKFTGAIRRLLGIPLRASNAFTRLCEVTEGIIDAPSSKEVRGGGVFKSILNNERGSVDTTPIRISLDKVKNIESIAKKMGMTIDEYLNSIGLDPETIKQFKGFMMQIPGIRKELHDKEPTLSKIVDPEERVVSQKVYKTKSGKITRVGIPITETQSREVMYAPRDNIWGSQHVVIDPNTGREKVRITDNFGERFMKATETRINAFRRFKMMDIYRDHRELKSNMTRELESRLSRFEELKKSLTPQERENFAIAAYADMKGVKEAYATMGITEIPEMTPKMHEIKKELQDFTKDILERVNYVRTHTGQRAIPKLLDENGNENYLPLARQMNVLRELGLKDGLVSSDVYRISEISKNYNGMFNPHAKMRVKSAIPIELDVFKAMENFSKYNLNEIYVGPVAALAKALADAKLPMEDVKGRTKLVDHNPALAQLLRDWSDEIMGVDHISSVMSIKNPFIRSAMIKGTKNITLATIAWSMRTMVVQPSSLIGTITNVGFLKTLGGVGKMMIDRPRLGREAEPWVKSRLLNVREPEIIGKDFADLVSQGMITGSKAWLGEKGLAGMKFFDGLMAEASWNAGYSYALDKLKYGEKDAINYADDMVERTQGHGVVGAVSPLQASVATKWLTLLQTFGIADFNYIVQDVLGFKNPDITKTQQMVRFLRYTAGMAIIGNMYKAIGQDNVMPDPIGAWMNAKKNHKNNLTALASAAGEFLEKVPIIGGSAKYGSSLGGVVGEWANLIPEAAKSFSQGLEWDKMTRKQKEHNLLILIRAIGYTMGIPATNQIVKSVRAEWRGGNPYEVIMGVYIKDKNRRSSFSGMGSSLGAFH